MRCSFHAHAEAPGFQRRSSSSVTSRFSGSAASYWRCARWASVAGCSQVALKGVANRILFRRFVSVCHDCRLNGCWLNHT